MTKRYLEISKFVFIATGVDNVKFKPEYNMRMDGCRTRFEFRLAYAKISLASFQIHYIKSSIGKRKCDLCDIRDELISILSTLHGD